MQSWDGMIRLFPAWPRDIEASFSTFRAEGAFLVSSSWKDGEVRALTVASEIGGRCAVMSPWGQDVEVRDGDRSVSIAIDTDIITFETTPGMTYDFARQGV